VIATELLLADLDQAQKNREKLLGSARSGNKEAKDTIAELERAIEGFNQGIPARRLGLQLQTVQAQQFLTAKPILYVANVGEEEISGNPLARQLEEYAVKEGVGVVVLSAKIEAEIAQLPEAERKEFLASLNLKESGLDRLVLAGQKLLKLMTFFTAGPEESRAWSIAMGTPAVKAAGKIHSDIEKGFIRAEIYSVEDMLKLRSEVALKEKGLIRLEGRDYIMKDGDVVYFRFNV
jgi:ribosome-binding ATPase